MITRNYRLFGCAYMVTIHWGTFLMDNLETWTGQMHTDSLSDPEHMEVQKFALCLSRESELIFFALKTFGNIGCRLCGKSDINNQLLVINHSFSFLQFSAPE